jgi:nucleoid-associated protein YgaU
MTRETKIGLLVGLAFIIVVGVLLSDYMSTAGAAQSAPLQLAGTNLRSGLGLPISDQSATAIPAPMSAAPRDIVPTNEELTQRINPAPPPPRPNSSLVDVARQNGEEVVNTDAPPSPVRPIVAAGPGNYEAVPGDSLSRIALKTLGANTRANREAIIAVNPALKDDPDRIIVGKSYVIPHSGAPAQAPISVSTTVNKPAGPSGTGTVYTVKPGDSLWSIAVNQVGTASAVEAIKSLNQDVLADADRLKVNMKLRLPAKPQNVQ